MDRASHISKGITLSLILRGIIMYLISGIFHQVPLTRNDFIC